MNNFAFFGTSRFSVIILDDLKRNHGIIPALIVTLPDMPKGRKQIIAPPLTKIWAEQNNVSVFQPTDLKSSEIKDRLKNFDFFVVASYGKIIPKNIIELPKKGALNIHPSLLPSYRGASPIQTQILNGEQTIGTTIMLMDEKMDHGPIISSKNVSFTDPHIGTFEDAEEKLAHESASLLADVIPKWLKDGIQIKDQEHEKATFTSIIKKEDGEIRLSDDPLSNYRKYLAFHEWPKVFFFTEEGGLRKRTIITDATFKDGKFEILKVIPEGKKEIPYTVYISNHSSS